MMAVELDDGRRVFVPAGKRAGRGKTAARRAARKEGKRIVIVVPAGVKVHLALGHTDMRKGLDGLATLIQEHLKKDPFSGALFVFRGKRGDLIKLLWWDTQGLCLFAKRLENGRFVWPMAAAGTVSLTAV
jgi:transposase